MLGFGLCQRFSLVCDWAFRVGSSESAGIYAGNFGSRRAFEKNGFALEGTLRQEVVSNGSRVDLWRMGLPRSSWCAAS